MYSKVNLAEKAALHSLDIECLESAVIDIKSLCNPDQRALAGIRLLNQIHNMLTEEEKTMVNEALEYVDTGLSVREVIEWIENINIRNVVKCILWVEQVSAKTERRLEGKDKDEISRVVEVINKRIKALTSARKKGRREIEPNRKQHDLYHALHVRRSRKDDEMINMAERVIENFSGSIFNMFLMAINRSIQSCSKSDMLHEKIDECIEKTIRCMESIDTHSLASIAYNLAQMGHDPTIFVEESLVREEELTNRSTEYAILATRHEKVDKQLTRELVNIILRQGKSADERLLRRTIDVLASKFECCEEINDILREVVKRWIGEAEKETSSNVIKVLARLASIDYDEEALEGIAGMYIRATEKESDTDAPDNDEIRYIRIPTEGEIKAYRLLLDSAKKRPQENKDPAIWGALMFNTRFGRQATDSLFVEVSKRLIEAIDVASTRTLTLGLRALGSKNGGEKDRNDALTLVSKIANAGDKTVEQISEVLHVAGRMNMGDQIMFGLAKILNELGGGETSRQLVEAAGALTLADDEEKARPLIAKLLDKLKTIEASSYCLEKAYKIAHSMKIETDYWKERYETAEIPKLKKKSENQLNSVEDRVALLMERYMNTRGVNYTPYHGYKLYGFECDILVDSELGMINVEFDGEKNHSNTRKTDTMRDGFLKDQGVLVIRVNIDEVRKYYGDWHLFREMVDKAISGNVTTSSESTPQEYPQQQTLPL